MKNLGVLCVLGTAVVLAACGGSEPAATSAKPKATASTQRDQRPPGGPAPAELQGVWKLASGNKIEKGLQFVIGELHYRVPTHLAHGDLAVNGDEIAFFNAAICGLTLPDGVGHYRWTVAGEKLSFESISEDPCGGRADILDGVTYTRAG